jgi:hypothetical protein
MLSSIPPAPNTIPDLTPPRSSSIPSGEAAPFSSGNLGAILSSQYGDSSIQRLEDYLEDEDTGGLRPTDPVPIDPRSQYAENEPPSARSRPSRAKSRPSSPDPRKVPRPAAGEPPKAAAPQPLQEEEATRFQPLQAPRSRMFEEDERTQLLDPREIFGRDFLSELREMAPASASDWDSDHTEIIDFEPDPKKSPHK